MPWTFTIVRWRRYAPRAILLVIAAKPTKSITNPELRSAVADHLATQINRTFLRSYRRNVRRMLQLSLTAVQQAISTDWIAAYKTYVSKEAEAQK